jgi:hypothetical protein
MSPWFWSRRQPNVTAWLHPGKCPHSFWSFQNGKKMIILVSQTEARRPLRQPCYEHFWEGWRNVFDGVYEWY